MAGDSILFQEALKRGSSFAWNEEWEKAAGEYRLALEEFPRDALARSYLAMALYRSGRLAESLEMYQVLWRAEPDNIAVLNRMTELQEALGDGESAAAGYRVLAELQARQGAHADAFKSWQKAVHLRPDDLSFWDSLMDSAVQVGEVASVLPGYLAAASGAAQQGRAEEAIRLAARARALAPEDATAAAILSDIHHTHGHIGQVTLETEEPLPEAEESLPEAEESLPEAEEALSETEDPLPDNVVRFARHNDPIVEFQQAPQTPPLPTADTLPDAPAYPVDLPVLQEEQPADAIKEEVASASADQVAGATAVEELAAQAPSKEGQTGVSDKASVEDIAQAQPEEPAETVSPSEMLEKAQAPGVGETDDKAEQRPEPVPMASEADEPEAQVAADQQDQSEGSALPTPAARPETSYGWGARAMDFGLEEASDAEESQPDAEVSSRPQQGRGLLGRMFGFIWQPGDGEQDDSQSPALPDASARHETPAMDFGLDEAPGVTPRRRDQTHYWGVKDFGLAEASEQGPEPISTGTSSEESPGASSPEDPAASSPEDPAAAESHPLGQMEPGEAEGAGPLPIEDSREAEAPERKVGETATSTSAGNSTAAELVALAEVYLQTGKVERSLDAYRRALDADPDFPRALLGMARLLLSSEQIEAAMENTRRAMEVSLPGTDEEALELLLEILREKAAHGDLGSVAEVVLWLRSNIGADPLSPALAVSLQAMPVELLGRTAGEHLEEIALLPPDVRGDCLAAIQATEEYLRQGHLRAAADEMYRVLSTQSDFLPAQSLLGRVLVAQGRVEEARDRVERLVRLYELRDDEAHALGVLWWAVVQRVVSGDARSRLAHLLRGQSRNEEAELIELGWVEPPPRSAPVPRGAPMSLLGRAATIRPPDLGGGGKL